MNTEPPNKVLFRFQSVPKFAGYSPTYPPAPVHRVGDTGRRTEAGSAAGLTGIPYERNRFSSGTVFAVLCPSDILELKG